MIIELLVGALLDVLTYLLDLIPDASLPAAAANALDSFAGQIGGSLGGLNGLLPISECMVFIGWVLGTYVPIVIALQTSMWVWAHLPIIGNGN